MPGSTWPGPPRKNGPGPFIFLGLAFIALSSYKPVRPQEFLESLVGSFPPETLKAEFNRKRVSIMLRDPPSPCWVVISWDVSDRVSTEQVAQG